MMANAENQFTSIDVDISWNCLPLFFTLSMGVNTQDLFIFDDHCRAIEAPITILMSLTLGFVFILFSLRGADTI